MSSLHVAKRLLVAGSLSVAMLTGTAYALQDQPHRDPLARADANGDGIVTREEMLASADARFTAMDANKDGKITPDERKAVAGGRPAMGMMGRGDANGDGAITRDEMRAQAGTRFDRIDTNHDGKLDKAERDAAMQRMMSMRGREHHMAPPANSPQTPPADQPFAPKG